MQNAHKENIETINSNNSNISNEPKVVQTDIGAVIGQDKCPKCGATDISPNPKNGHLRCNFCRYEFMPEQITGFETDISKLEGQVLASGATDIVADAKDVITIKCSSCGAEVVLDTNEALHARCHWCRHSLSVNQQIPNGSVPDVILPFHITKEDARASIEQFVKKRRFFAHPKFKEEFTTENIMGVYFPYMIVDVNGHATLVGQGEHLVRRYTIGSGDDRETVYDADLYNVTRDFDVTVHDLTVESNSDRLDKNSETKTNNIINSIMPFDTQNCVKWNANYLKGYTSERRDTNVGDLSALVNVQAKDVARFAANESLTYYDRGVAWHNEQFNVKGQQWQAAYLPVWLYSYQQVKGNKQVLHYVAVNARTKETMGSVPLHKPKLFLISFLIEFLAILGVVRFDFEEFEIPLLLTGFVFYFIMYARYRNAGARHKHESETKSEISNMQKQDVFVKQQRALKNRYIRGCNNTSISGQSMPTNIFQAIDQNGSDDLFNQLKK